MQLCMHRRIIGNNCHGSRIVMDLQIRLMVDASAALGVAQWQSICKINHSQTRALWLHKQELRKLIKLKKVNDFEKRNDIMTNNVSRELIDKHPQSHVHRIP